ncbi:MAG: Acetyltransferase, GNAT family [uncultured Corynebacteriales bacterium]|uniref:Acetyltransferase, GNAT family n=1 Tax=uncultured Mycobacteriales bacterium TaxID=581187 RepID=A0A6J4IEH6_9ACTN|nr:MAG: Acetyltransferase, GNAT family [uncultured Corynebacteriales bacterium]
MQAGTVAVARLDDPVVLGLVELLQAEYVVRYGGRDDAPIDAAEFAPPRGLFLLATAGGEPVAMGGWRALGDGRAELKRMFVVEAARGRGYARTLLAELERTAAAAGIDRMVLETGTEQPEAMALYASAGYDPIAGFGHYADAPRSRAFGKRLAS